MKKSFEDNRLYLLDRLHRNPGRAHLCPVVSTLRQLQDVRPRDEVSDRGYVWCEQEEIQAASRWLKCEGGGTDFAGDNMASVYLN